MLRTVKCWAAAAALSVMVTTAAWAADAGGKWNWVTRFNNQERTTNAEFKQDGEKLTGTISGRNNTKVEIKEGTVKGGEVSFVVIRERNGQEFKQTFKGKLEGDTIKGKIKFTVNGEERERDWEAKRGEAKQE
jgi:hypothetical protein